MTVSKHVNFDNLVSNRYTGVSHVVNVKFYSIITGIVFLLLVNCLLYLIAYTDSKQLFGLDLTSDWMYGIKYYVYWIIFFNNIIIPTSVVYLYFLFTDNITKTVFVSERKKSINHDDSINI